MSQPSPSPLNNDSLDGHMLGAPADSVVRGAVLPSYTPNSPEALHFERGDFLCLSFGQVPGFKTYGLYHRSQYLLAGQA